MTYNSTRYWEILDEEGTDQKLTFHQAAVPFKIPFLEKADGECRSFLELKFWKTNIFFH